MKQLICEMCGSTELIKQNGVFICQSCGCKYSVEEAKKMIIEGTVDVTGSTVKVDASEKINKLYTIARRAKVDGNYEKAAQYYDMILQEEPMNWEASFYTTYFSAMQTKIAYIEFAATKVSNCIDTVLKLIHNNVPKENQELAVSEITLSIATISSLFSKASKDHYFDIDIGIRNNYTLEYYNRIVAIKNMLYNLGDQIDNIFIGNSSIQQLAIKPWETGLSMTKAILDTFQNKISFNEKQHRMDIVTYTRKLSKYDTKYKKKYESLQKDEEKKQLKTSIGLKDTRIANINTTGKLEFYDPLGKFFTVCGIIMIIVSLFGIFISLYIDELGGFFVAGLLIGIFEIIGGICVGKPSRPSKEKVAANIEEVKKLKAEREELKKKLATLEKNSDN